MLNEEIVFPYYSDALYKYNFKLYNHYIFKNKFIDKIFSEKHIFLNENMNLYDINLFDNLYFNKSYELNDINVFKYLNKSNDLDFSTIYIDNLNTCSFSQYLLEVYHLLL